MPDISMCRNERCPSKDKCYRFKAKPNPYRQSYMEFDFVPADGKCEWFVFYNPHHGGNR